MDLERLFRHILKPALGCTEPVAVALASAAATQTCCGWRPDPGEISEVTPESIGSITVKVSRSIFKNSFAISIPNAEGHKGIVIAAALGVLCDPRKGMRLFEDLRPEHVDAAESLVEKQLVKVEVDERALSEVYIRTEVATKAGTGACLIRNEHSNIACLWQNGTIVHGSDDSAKDSSRFAAEVEELGSLTLAQVVALVEDLPKPVFDLLRATVEKNLNACKEGLSKPMGIGTGYFGAGTTAPQDYYRVVASLTAAGSDARMSGHPVEIMSSAGSGNQGIMATIPIVVYANTNLIDEQRMLKAVALSHLVTMYVTTYIGYLSALCGVAMKAGIGAACGLTYLMGGGVEDIERAVKIMAATLTGMICDGAKAGCALKVSSAADMATRAATLAIRKAEVPDDNGIVAPTAGETIQNLAKLNQSMRVVDQDIIRIMLGKIGS